MKATWSLKRMVFINNNSWINNNWRKQVRQRDFLWYPNIAITIYISWQSYLMHENYRFSKVWMERYALRYCETVLAFWIYKKIYWLLGNVQIKYFSLAFSWWIGLENWNKKISFIDRNKLEKKINLTYF